MLKRLTLAATLLAFTVALPAQNTGANAENPPQNNKPTPAAAKQATTKQAPKPAAQEAPGGGPDKVWVNTNSNVYHCPGDRYYGKTAHGRYMTEAAAKSAGAHGVGNKTCSISKANVRMTRVDQVPAGWLGTAVAHARGADCSCYTGVIIPPTGIEVGSDPGRRRCIASAMVSVYFNPAPVLNKITRSLGLISPLATRLS